MPAVLPAAPSPSCSSSLPFGEAACCACCLLRLLPAVPALAMCTAPARLVACMPGLRDGVCRLRRFKAGEAHAAPPHAAARCRLGRKQKRDKIFGGAKMEMISVRVCVCVCVYARVCVRVVGGVGWQAGVNSCERGTSNSRGCFPQLHTLLCITAAAAAARACSRSRLLADAFASQSPAVQIRLLHPPFPGLAGQGCHCHFQGHCRH